MLCWAARASGVLITPAPEESRARARGTLTTVLLIVNHLRCRFVGGQLPSTLLDRFNLYNRMNFLRYGRGGGVGRGLGVGLGRGVALGVAVGVAVGVCVAVAVAVGVAVGVWVKVAVAVAVGVGVGVNVAVGVGVDVAQVSVYCWLSLVPVPGAELPATA